MRRLISSIALILGLTVATTAEAGAIRSGEDLRLVAPTKIPNATPISLCHLVDYMEVLFIPVYTIVEGYALSNDGCDGKMYSNLSAEQFAELKALGLVAASVPDAPTVDLKSLLWGHAWLIIGAFSILFRAIGALAGRGRRARKGAPDNLAIHSLVAMSQVAVADGRIDQSETRQIATILTRLTGTSYGPDQVAHMLNQLNPSPSDLAQVGQDLSENDRQIVLEAALNIAAADGDIHPSEYAVLTDLAHRMMIGAEQFRTTVARLSPHLRPA